MAFRVLNLDELMADCGGPPAEVRWVRIRVFHPLARVGGQP
jgi:hypothetical protein